MHQKAIWVGMNRALEHAGHVAEEGNRKVRGPHRSRDTDGRRRRRVWFVVHDTVGSRSAPRAWWSEDIPVATCGVLIDGPRTTNVPTRKPPVPMNLASERARAVPALLDGQFAVLGERDFAGEDNFGYTRALVVRSLSTGIISASEQLMVPNASAMQPSLAWPQTMGLWSPAGVATRVQTHTAGVHSDL